MGRPLHQATVEQILVNYLMNRDAHTRYVKLCRVCLACGGDHPGTGRSGVPTIPRFWTGLEHGTWTGVWTGPWIHRSLGSDQ